MTTGGLADKDVSRLLEAIVVVSRETDLAAVLQRIVEVATELVDARYGALGVISTDGTALSEFLTVGVDDDARAAIGHPPEGLGLLGELITHPEPIRLPDLHAHPNSHGWPPGHPDMTRFLGVPVRVRDEVFGNLYLCDRHDGEPFSERDEQLVIGLAATAGVAIEHARLYERITELGVLEDRERIARELHDTVIQRIFATGLALQALAARIDDLDQADRLRAAVDDLDETVRHIRTTIFELGQRRLPGTSVRQDLLEVVAEAARSLGFDPAVRFDGPVDLTVDARRAAHLLPAAREALSNAVRHAAPTEVEIRVLAREGWLTLEVLDDGRGVDETVESGGRGLGNLRSRAEELGGTFEIQPRPGGGTAARWRVPLDDGR